MSAKAERMIDQLGARFERLAEVKWPSHTGWDAANRDMFLDECWDSLEEHLYMATLKRVRLRNKFGELIKRNEELIEKHGGTTPDDA
jgi:hypothetical protein